MSKPDHLAPIFDEKMKAESIDSLEKLIAEGNELLPNKKKLNAAGTLRKGDMLQSMVDAAKRELKRRKQVINAKRLH